MSYMKRAVKKTISLENSGTKILKPASAKISKQEKSATLQKKSAVIAEKTSVSILKTQKTVAVNQPAKQKKVKIVPPVSIKNLKSEKVKILPKTINKKVKAIEKKAEIAIPAIRTKSEKTTKSVKTKTEQKIEKKLEIVIPPITPKPVKKKIKPIGSAVVRGKTGRYDFEIFPLDAELKDGSAIYVISKRITDKGGRGHHKFVCIGQTESLLGDLKKHTKDKCIKQHKANVICLLREENEKNRVKIETDLRQAHTLLACNHQ